MLYSFFRFPLHPVIYLMASEITFNICQKNVSTCFIWYKLVSLGTLFIKKRLNSITYKYIYAINIDILIIKFSWFLKSFSHFFKSIFNDYHLLNFYTLYKIQNVLLLICVMILIQIYDISFLSLEINKYQTLYGNYIFFPLEGKSNFQMFRKENNICKW